MGGMLPTESATPRATLHGNPISQWATCQPNHSHMRRGINPIGVCGYLTGLARSKPKQGQPVRGFVPQTAIYAEREYPAQSGSEQV